ncbi:type I restriction-modification system subunit M N-terminal domain-containing protein [Sorangium sp. So ce1024]
MSNPSAQIVQKLWSYCNVLRDDGLSYGDYVEQLTFLLFLKMAHERTQPPWSHKPFIPAGYDWPALLARDGDALEVQYRKTLDHLGRQPACSGSSSARRRTRSRTRRSCAASSRISSTASSGRRSTPT